MNYFKYKSIVYMALQNNVDIRIYSDEVFARKEINETEHDGTISTYYLSRADFDEFMKELKNINFNSWKREYINPAVLDGAGWEIEYCYNDTIKKMIGSNDYPEEWDDFMDILSSLLKKFDKK